MTWALRIDARDPAPPYEQVRRAIAEHVAAGRLSEGERLPPVRQLAGDLGVAAGTVARAYRELEAAGVVRTRRGGGTTVAPGARQVPSALPAPGARTGAGAAADDAASPAARALTALEAAVARAHAAGVADAEIRGALERALARGRG